MTFFSKMMIDLGLKADPNKKKKSEYRSGRKLPKGDQRVLGYDKTHELSDFIDLYGILRFECYGEKPVGAILLRRRDKMRVVFGFDVLGYHSFSLESELEDLWYSIMAATRTMPEGEPLGMRLSSFKRVDERRESLIKLARSAPNPELQSLAFAEIQNIQRLAAQGYREPKKLEVFPSFSGYENEDVQSQADQFVLSATQIIDSLYGLYVGDKKKKEQQEITSFFLQAYQSYSSWADLLRQSIGVEVIPKSDQDIWEYLYARINRSKATECPYVIRFIHDSHSTEIKVEKETSRDLCFHLQEECVPKFDPQFVRLDHYRPKTGDYQNTYIGAIRYHDKMPGWDSGYSQLRYLWQILTHDSVTDTEIYVQLIAKSKSKAAKAAGKLYQQAMLEVKNAAQKTRFAAGAERTIEEAKQAMLSLSQGATPCTVGAFILVHRPSLKELERGLRDLKTKLLPAPISIEKDAAYRLWCQATFCDYNHLMQVKGIGDLRITYQSHEVAGFFPMLSTRLGNKDGVEFIARDGGTPYHVQLFKQGREVHMAIIAGHRTGKSNLATDFATEALCRGVPVTVLDYPTKDGRSTFYHYSQYVGGAYLDIGNESINILELPDLRHLKPQLQSERFSDFKIFVFKSILALLNPPPDLKQDVEDVISSAIQQFYSDVIIQQRYEDAITAGFGSQAWQNTPTLVDFKDYCIPEKLPLSRDQATNPSVQRAFNFITRRLTAKLDSPIGKTIGHPSTIQTDRLFTVFALRSMEDEDSSVYSLAAFSIAARKALEHPISYIVIDEAQQLADFESICDLAKTYVTTGAKQGIRCCFITNDFSALSESPAGKTIMANLNIKIIGKLENEDAKRIGEAFDIPSELMKYTHGSKFDRERQKLANTWLINESGKSIIARRYAAPFSLSLAASNLWEVDTRQAYMDHYGKIQGVHEFSKVHIPALKNGQALKIPDFIESSNPLEEVSYV